MLLITQYGTVLNNHGTLRDDGLITNSSHTERKSLFTHLVVGLFSCLVAILPKTLPKLLLKPEWLRNDDEQISFMQDVPYLNQHENGMNVSVSKLT